MNDKILEMIVIEEKLKELRKQNQEERPYLQLEIDDFLEVKKKENKVEPKRVIIIEI